MKKVFKKISAFFCRYINGTKGAVSLLLALVMTPMLSISLMLVESARYQSAVEALEEIADICGFSTLGHYDSYMQSRFGLFSVSQEKLANDLFKEYLNANVGHLGNSVSIKDSTKASGKHALSSQDVLRQQIVEQSEISVISKTIYEGLDIDKLVEKLEELLNLDALTKQMDVLNAGADIATTVADLVDGATKIKEAYKEYNTAKTAYHAAYDAVDANNNPVGFKTDMKAYIQALKTAEANLTEEDDHDDVYSDKDVKDAKSDLKSSNKTYYKAADSFKSALKTLRDEIVSFQSTLDGLPDKIVGLSTKTKQAQDTDSKVFDATSTDWVAAVASEIITRLGTVAGDDFSKRVQDDMDAIAGQVTTLKNLESGDFKSVQSSWNSSTIDSKYRWLNADSISKDFGSAVNGIFNALNNKVEKEPLSIGYLLEVVNKLLNIQGVYNGSLNAAVSKSKLYKSTKTGLTDTLLMDSIDNVCEAAESFRNAADEDGLSKVWEYIKAMASMLTAIAEFLLSIITFAGELLVGVVMLAEILVNPGEVYNDLLMYGWAAYNMPNRVTCTSEKSLTGYSYKNIFLENGGSLTDYKSGLPGGSFGVEMQSSGGSDPAFKGAVQEYLMVGSLSEYQNQSIAFVKLYLFRLVLNIPQILSNAELTAMSAPAGPFAILIKILVGIADPMLDTVFLVNGEDAPLIKQKLFLTPSGIESLCKKLVNIVCVKGMSTLISNEMEKSFKSQKKDTGTDTSEDTDTDSGETNSGGTDSGGTSSGGTSGGSTDSGGTDSDGDNEGKTDKKKSDFLECSYGDHLYLLSFLTCDDDEYMTRIQNVIQMEAAQYYSKNGSYAFKLENAHTYIKMDLQYVVHPMFAFDVLPDGGVFNVSTSRYVGY